MKQIEGIVKGIIYESVNSPYKVIKVLINKKEEILIGNMPTIIVEGKYIFNVENKQSEKYGQQLEVVSYETKNHDSKDGLIDYLSSENFVGIGKKTATKIVEELGLDAIKKIKEDPNCLIPLKFGKEKSLSLYNQLMEFEQTEDIFINLYSYDLSKKMAKKIYDLYGNQTINKINNNPYILINDLQGFGFYKCDALAHNMGISLHNELRLCEAMIFTINSACNQYGFTFITKTQLINSTLSLLNKKESDKIEENELIYCIKHLISSNKVVTQGERYYPKYLYDAEINTKERLMSILNHKSNLISKDKALKLLDEVENKLGFKMLSLQCDAVLNSISSKISIITGGPGTGKTTIIRAILILEAYLNNVNVEDKEFQNNILLVSPTGKASKRMTISCGMKAQTIHHALGYQADGTFLKTKLDKLHHKLIIVDESSMIDITLMSNFLDAIKDDARIIFVGDENQLPSVGPGNVLYEMIHSDLFFTTTLKQIMRQKSDSNIIKLSQMVLNKNVDYNIFNEKKEVYFYNADSQLVLKNIEDLIRLYIKKGNDFVKDIQILVPMYNGVCGIDNINKMIQEKFNNSNGNFIVDGDRIFKENDKVMMLQNNPTLGVMNGDDGIIKSIEHIESNDYIHIDFSGIMVRLERKDLDQITLAYAISIHKSQGSEFKNVIIPIVSAFQIMLKPNLIYTAITRAKEKLIILGSPLALNQALYQKNDIRQTSLFNMQTNNIVSDGQTKKVIYINNPEIPFETLGEENMENISPYDFM